MSTTKHRAKSPDTLEKHTFDFCDICHKRLSKVNSFNGSNKCKSCRNKKDPRFQVGSFEEELYGEK